MAVIPQGHQVPSPSPRPGFASNSGRREFVGTPSPGSSPRSRAAINNQEDRPLCPNQKPFQKLDEYIGINAAFFFLDHKPAAKEGLERDAKENFQALDSTDDGPAVDPNYRGTHLQLQFTVEDEGVFTMPWSATITYRRPLGEWAEYVCAENRHEYYAGNDSAVPRADKPDF